MARWFAAAVLVGAAFFGLGILGVFGRPHAPVARIEVVGATADGGVALDCPAGQPLTTIWPGSHVAVLARSADSAFVSVRSASLAFDTVWVSAASVDLTPADLASLAVDGCRTPAPLGGTP